MLTAGGLAPCLSSAVGGLIERYTESHSESVIIITGHMKYRYNAKGLRIAEEVVKNQETQFENAIEYR